MKRRLGGGKQRTASTSNPKWQAWRSALRKKFPENFKRFQMDLRKVDVVSVSEYLVWARRLLFVLGLFFLAGITARLLGSFIKPAVLPPSPRSAGPVGRPAPKDDYGAILRRNMFNVQGTIPDPFDQGQLDCFSQARATTAPMQMLGTIVMNDDKFSVALVQEEGNPAKVAVRKDDTFFNNKYTAMKVERFRLCFQVRATQDFEFVEIPQSGQELGLTGPRLQGSGEGIVPKAENQFEIKADYLEKNLQDLNRILQSARAVPHTDATGKFRGFLIQSLDQGSIFAQLGIRQGDVLTTVNDIVLDNPGKGLEAFQKLRNSQKISLQVLRGGQQTTMSYDVKP